MTANDLQALDAKLFLAALTGMHQQAVALVATSQATLAQAQARIEEMETAMRQLEQAVEIPSGLSTSRWSVPTKTDAMHQPMVVNNDADD